MSWLDALYFVGVTLATVGCVVGVWHSGGIDGWMDGCMMMARGWRLIDGRTAGRAGKRTPKSKDCNLHTHTQIQTTQVRRHRPLLDPLPRGGAGLRLLLPRHHPLPDRYAMPRRRHAHVCHALHAFTNASSPGVALLPHTHTPTTHPPTPNTPKKGKLMEALSTRSRSYYRSMYFRPVRGTEHILILGRVTYTVLAR